MVEQATAPPPAGAGFNAASVMQSAQHRFRAHRHVVFAAWLAA
jgi:hypothetical protein